MKKHSGEIPEGHRVNKHGILVRSHERVDPVPKASAVKFKRPLSAHERVVRAIKLHEQMRAIESLPGDDTLDSDPIEEKTPYQLMTDPKTGEEMTAGEYVMLQHERAQASKEVREAAARSKYRTKKLKEEADLDSAPKTKLKKAAKAAEPDEENEDE